jgi:SHAQKYF class myb-like DNA-binding protein
VITSITTMAEEVKTETETSIGEVVVPAGQENTGRWTKQEHAAFLQGIEKYGKEWKKVAGMVRTRTVMQTRTHAQKYYEKLSQVAAKVNGTPGKTPVSISYNSTRQASNDAETSGPDPKKKEAKKAAVPKGEGGAKAHKNLKSPTRASDTTPFPTPTSPMPVVTFTDKDILLPINDVTGSRVANKEYMELMKANCFIFHSLPAPEQVWFVRNLTHFMTTVRERRWIACNHRFGYPTQYQLLTDPSSVVAADFRVDPLKVAAFQFHPFWLLGEHDPDDVHQGAPFVHRTVDGTWKAVTTAQVKDILKGEGPKNLLLLPPSIQLTPETAEKSTEDAKESPAKKMSTEDKEKEKPGEKAESSKPSVDAKESTAKKQTTDSKAIEKPAEKAESAKPSLDAKESPAKKQKTEKAKEKPVEKVGEKGESKKTESKAVKADSKGKAVKADSKGKAESKVHAGKAVAKTNAKDDVKKGDPKEKKIEGDQGDVKQRRSKRARM